jgi:uncharacterized integral membrane protein
MRKTVTDLQRASIQWNVLDIGFILLGVYILYIFRIITHGTFEVFFTYRFSRSTLSILVVDLKDIYSE